MKWPFLFFEKIIEVVRTWINADKDQIANRGVRKRLALMIILKGEATSSQIGCNQHLDAPSRVFTQQTGALEWADLVRGHNREGLR